MTLEGAHTPYYPHRTTTLLRKFSVLASSCLGTFAKSCTSWHFCHHHTTALFPTCTKTLEMYQKMTQNKWFFLHTTIVSLQTGTAKRDEPNLLDFVRFCHKNIRFYTSCDIFVKKQSMLIYRQHFYDLWQHNVTFFRNVLSIRVVLSRYTFYK